MADKLKTIRSFADIPAEAKAQIVEKHWVKWDPTAFRINSLELAMRPLAFWLDARFAELVSEKVPPEEILVQQRGARTVIVVRGKPRFEFKLKMQMETCSGS